jgi:hypothetical protein
MPNSFLRSLQHRKKSVAVPNFYTHFYQKKNQWLSPIFQPACFKLTFHKIIIINKFMKYDQLAATIHAPVFSRQDLLIHGLKVYDYQFTLWVKKGYLVRLRNGLYVFARDLDKIKSEDVAWLLYQPSYISLESALSFYGFIPEMVYAHTSVTARTNRTFENCFGQFIYRHIKKDLFWGYTEISESSNRYGFYLMAEPEKALLDYLYLNLGNINSQADIDGIRLNNDELRRRLDEKKFRKYLSAFAIEKLSRWALRCLP